ncbi:MAG: hypothetical protein PHO14_02340 [Kiritimatiellae bacterium]|jgi:hypothetical protein|nr:hypothetical protein [Kiritimatiellia bacterium]MDD4341055.1 hypothetical protein [Kiritimatiellia bacterium]MDY0149619.1 hypothetical protein [Kiritimatiellia bacterium]
MASRQPTSKELEAFRARARLRARAEKQRQEARKSRIRWAFWVLGAVMLVALLADMRHISSRLVRFQRTGWEARKGDAADIADGLDGERYVDASGLFSLVPPRHWTTLRKTPDSPFNVVFQGPYGMDMAIQVVVTNGLTFEHLIENLRRVERNLSAHMPMEFAYVGPYRAVKRSAQLFKNKVLLLDFLTGNLAHHVQFSVPPELYDEYEPVFLRLMQTYAPGQIVPSP